MIIREKVKVAEMQDMTAVRIYDYYPLERKIKVYVQLVVKLDLEPFGAGVTYISTDLAEFRGTAFNVDGCRFLQAVGNDNKAGRLIDVEFVEVDDEWNMLGERTK